MVDGQSVFNHSRRVILLTGFSIMIVGAILLPVSKMAQKRIDYQWKDTVFFAKGQPMEFNWTFVESKSYRFEVFLKTWTPGGGRDDGATMLFRWPDSSAGSSIGRNDEPPWVWYSPKPAGEYAGEHVRDVAGEYPFNGTRTLEVWFTNGNGFDPSDAEEGTHVNLYETVETVSSPYDYLLYAGASLAIIDTMITAIGLVLSVSKLEKLTKE